jgi:hypothetical protein
MNRRALFLGTLSAVCGVIAVAACGGDDSSPATTGTPDASTDSTSEAAIELDSSAPDTSKLPDTGTGKPDAADAGDAGDAGACVAVDVGALDDASVAAGFQQVWQVYRCAGCHQKPSQTVDDAGNGIVLSGNNNGLGDSGTIFPPNLTGDPPTGLGCWTDSQIQNALLTGIDNEGKALCSPMPKFGSALTTADGGPRLGYPMDAGTAKEIVDYLRSLPVAVNHVTDTTCPSPSGGDAGDAGRDGSSDGSPE